eukprot:4886833-Lingulodinium_polyedra.AAC.1
MLLMIVEGQVARLDAVSLPGVVCALPKYRDVMQRVALGPVGQTVSFGLVLRLFFARVLGVRPAA